jgi:hypothetical protein
VVRAVRFFLVVLTLLAAARPGLADDQREADRWIRHGIELRKAHDDEGAVREFQRAYDAIHTPRAAGQLGLAEQALGRWEDAEHHVREAMQASNDAWIVKNQAVLADALGIIQGHLGRVEVMGDPEGADVSVNGRKVGKLPLAEAVPVSAGQVDVDLRAPGYQPAQRTLTIVAGQYQRVVLHLASNGPPVDQRPSATPETVPGQSTERAEPPTVVPIEKSADAPAEGPSATRTGLKWASAALAVVSLGVGVTFTIVERQNVSSYESYTNCDNRGGTAYYRNTDMTYAACQEALNQYQLDQKLAYAGFIGAGAFAITWLILELTEPSAPAKHAEQAMTAPLCAPSGLGLACALRF